MLAAAPLSLSSVEYAQYSPSSRHHQQRRLLDENAQLIPGRALNPSLHVLPFALVQIPPWVRLQIDARSGYSGDDITGNRVLHQGKRPGAGSNQLVQLRPAGIFPCRRSVVPEPGSK